MPSREKMYLVRDTSSGKLATVLAYSTRGAIKLYRARYRPPAGLYEVKERGIGAWETYKILYH